MNDNQENSLKNKGYIIPSWNEFKGQPDPFSNCYAYTYWNITYSYNWTKSSDGKTTVTLTHHFPCKKILGQT